MTTHVEERRVVDEGSYEVEEDAREEELLAEARAIHRALYSSACDPLAATKYVEAHAYYFKSVVHTDLVFIRWAVRRNLDLEAMEAAFRLVRRDHPLVGKFKLMTYITEGLPASYPRLVNERRQRVRALFTLLHHLAKTPYAVAKGLLLNCVVRSGSRRAV